MKVIGNGSVVRRDRKKDGTLKPQERCRLWDLSLKLEDGGRRTERFEGSYREARAALAEFAERVEREGAEPDGGGLAFAEYADRWHARRAGSGMLARRTVEREVYRLRSAKMHLGDMPMGGISTADVEDCYSALMRGESPTGKRLQPWSISSIHTTLSALFNDAERDGVVVRAPTKGAKRPPIPDIMREVPEAADVDAMVDSLDPDDPRQLAIMLCALCGLRRSEAVMVAWEDYDGSRLRISKAAEDDGTPKPTKNVMSRDVPVPTVLRGVLDARRGAGTMCPMRPTALSLWWRRNRARWAMDGVRLHDLRHAYATRLAEAGVHPRVMMQLGGWRTIDVCMRIYTHVNSVALDDAVSAAFG